MKKFIFFVFIACILFLSPVCNALENRTSVTLVTCKSADDIWVKIGSEKKRIRLLAFDRGDGDLNSEIDHFICRTLESSKLIEIEYDGSTKTDKYNRELVFVYTDGSLFQKKLLEHGYGQVNYVTARYNYLDSLCESQKQAIQNKLGIWNYDGIKEVFCKSGISSEKDKKETQEKKSVLKKYNQKELFYLLMLNAQVLILLLLYSKRRKQ